MRILETKVYTYDELSDKAKEKARQWYREHLDFDFAQECVIEDAKEIGKILGIDIDKIFYRGFWSQGDGACFEGTYQYAKDSVKKIKEYAPCDEELHRIAKSLQDVQRKHFYKLVAKCEHRGHYYHSLCMSIDVEHNEDTYRDIGSAEEDIKSALRYFADWIYDRLEDAWNCENSDEAIEEDILLNEYEFTEDGKIC